MGKSEGGADRRRMGDRRSRSRPRLKFFLLGGRRKSARRGDEKKEFIYVDQYRPWLLVAILLLAILLVKCDEIFMRAGNPERNQGRNEGEANATLRF